MARTTAVRPPRGDGTDAGDAAARPLRADARRNRDALVATAAELFDERGADAPLEEVARRAGVGIGTLYRHFPTRDAIVADVYRREIEKLCDPVPGLIEQYGPDGALSEWAKLFVAYAVRKRGLVTALKSMMSTESELFRQSRADIYAAVGTLVTAAVDAGVVRADADPPDLLRALGGVCLACEGDTDDPDRTGRLVRLVLDGLRYGAPSPA